MTQFFKLQLAQSLTQDFLKEGFLFKTGPKPSDGFKRRWFTLDGRKLMYHDQKLVNKCLTLNLICNKFNSIALFFKIGSLPKRRNLYRPLKWRLQCSNGPAARLETQRRGFHFSRENAVAIVRLLGREVRRPWRMDGGHTDGHESTNDTSRFIL